MVREFTAMKHDPIFESSRCAVLASQVFRELTPRRRSETERTIPYGCKSTKRSNSIPTAPGHASPTLLSELVRQLPALGEPLDDVTSR